MKNKILKYLWIFEFIAAAFVIVMGILCAVKSEALYLIIGFIFVILGGLRLIPLIKTTDDKLLKVFYAIEIVADVAVGGLILYFGFNKPDSTFMNKSIGYFVGGILYLRGFVYFFATSVKHEKYDIIQFFLHIILITLGAVIIGRGGFKLSQLAWFLFAIAMVCALFICYSGYRGYRNYRNQYYSETKSKKIKAKKGDAKEMPTSDEINDQNHTELNA